MRWCLVTIAMAALSGCGSSRATPPPASPSKCAEPQPDPRYVCAEDCPPRLARPNDPPPRWVWVPPERVRDGKVFPCPICLPKGTQIATPNGPLPVEAVRAGTVVWSLDETARRVAAPVLIVGSTPVVDHQIVRIRLGDGRTVSASPGHPDGSGRSLGSLVAGDRLDGQAIVDTAVVPYRGDRTYDLLPGGATGIYFADGVPLASTLHP